MKIKKGFAKREIAGSFIVVPVGKKSLEFNGMITLNESGSFMWDCLNVDTTVNEIVKRVTEEYEVEPERARADVDKFVKMLKENDLIDD